MWKLKYSNSQVDKIDCKYLKMPLVKFEFNFFEILVTKFNKLKQPMHCYLFSKIEAAKFEEIKLIYSKIKQISLMKFNS